MINIEYTERHLASQVKLIEASKGKISMKGEYDVKKEKLSGHIEYTGPNADKIMFGLLSIIGLSVSLFGTGYLLRGLK